MPKLIARRATTFGKVNCYYLLLLSVLLAFLALLAFTSFSNSLIF
ncbi:hypothetical protein HMPREF9078_01089 [Capnocytophaga sp. oral taxon 380 str. F0488]|nr:hypothetical protein HMPREF9078_01089 [Capnocytophaga sp. oral taxon 380 str. F0488]